MTITVGGGESGGATTLLEVHERLTREKLVGREGQNMDELDSSFRLLLLLNSLDLSLLYSSVQQLGKWVEYQLFHSHTYMYFMY